MNDELTAESAVPSEIPPESATTAYRVSAGEFEGPLDLLLHLVRINEVDVTDIPIVEITEQYNQHLDLMREMNLQIAGEFLVMAATLMHIKSRMLLPPDPDLGEEGELVDPRAELAQQLIEHQRFKLAAENLQALDSRRNLIWTRDAASEEFAGEELLVVDLFDLLSAFRELLGRLGEEARLQLRRDTVSVAEKIAWLSDLLEQRRSIDFFDLLEDLPTRLDRIAAFLALLEMIRLRMVVAFQRKLLGEIRLTRAPEHEGAPERPQAGSVADTEEPPGPTAALGGASRPGGDEAEERR